MTNLDEAMKLATQEARVVGLWLATHPEIPCIGPMQGMQLSEIYMAAGKLLLQDPDPIINADVAAFLKALDLVIHVEAIHQGAIINMFQQWVEAQDGKN